MSAKLKHSEFEHAWELEGHRVTQLAIDPHSVRLLTWSLQASAELRLGVPFDFTEIDGIVHRVVPDEPETIAPLLTLINRTILSLRVTRPGYLHASFADGSSLAIGPDRKVEAWEVSGAGALEGMRYLCAPGGSVPWEL
jgi:hypothetical protein